MDQNCPDCGAPLPDNQPCETYFHQMLYWENEDPANGRVHHLAVLCYHLQHPALYSPEGLEHGRWLLTKFVQDGIPPESIRQQTKTRVASNNRTWKVKGTADSYGSYDTQIMWQMNAADVVNDGIDNYCQNIEKWAEIIHQQINLIQGEK